MNATAATPAKIIRDKEFAKRLEIACERNVHAPSGHGRQKWVKDQLESMFDIKVSAEAARKWFAGEARPRPDLMAKIAKVLDVDEAWLSLGIAPGQTPVEKRRHNALAAGAVNLAASLFQLNGGSIAFTDHEGDKGHDFQAIINGKVYTVEVKYVAEKTPGATIKLAFDRFADDHLLIVVVGNGMDLGDIQMLKVSAETLKQHGKRKGGYTELTLNSDGKKLIVGEEALPVIKDFRTLING